MFQRLRRNRKSASIRALVQENTLSPSDLIAPLFVLEGEKRIEPIPTLPHIFRYSIDQLLPLAERYHTAGVAALALFPVIDPSLRDEFAKESYNSKGLIPRAVAALKENFPSLTLITDVALDPYTSHGHDGIVDENGLIDNDATLAILVKQALMQADAGVDIVAPSDMMDGRVHAIRSALDHAHFTQTNILSYTAKYASAYYGPFRDALGTRLAFGDKKSYQMNPANKREALLEAAADSAEGADMLLVKPALPYLDVLAALRAHVNLPVGAYHVSGEYAMVMAAEQAGMLDADAIFYEQALCLKRAGADFFFTYAIDSLLRSLHVNHANFYLKKIKT